MKQTLGNAIKNRRKKLNMSIAELTRRIDMDRSYIHKIENKSKGDGVSLISYWNNDFI